MRTKKREVGADTKQCKGWEHAMTRALQAKMGDEGGDHENGNAQGTEADDFQIVIEQHDGKGEF